MTSTCIRWLDCCYPKRLQHRLTGRWPSPSRCRTRHASTQRHLRHGSSWGLSQYGPVHDSLDHF